MLSSILCLLLAVAPAAGSKARGTKARVSASRTAAKAAKIRHQRKQASTTHVRAKLAAAPAPKSAQDAETQALIGLIDRELGKKPR